VKSRIILSFPPVSISVNGLSSRPSVRSLCGERSRSQWYDSVAARWFTMTGWRTARRELLG
jgi:hypothetical protein